MDFAQIRASAEQKAGSFADGTPTKIFIGAPGENAAGNRLYSCLKQKAEEQGSRIAVIRSGSFGYNDFEPVLVVDVPGDCTLLCLNANPDVAGDFEANAFAAGLTKGDGDWYLLRGESETGMPRISSIPSIALQNRIVLRNCGWIDPGSLHQYVLQSFGFQGLNRVLQKERGEGLELMVSSAYEDHIRPGSSSLEAWKDILSKDSRNTTLVCNGMATGPGEAFVRFILENDPFSFLEGLAIGAYIAGAAHCIIYVEAGSPASPALKKALDAMRECTLIGGNILDTEFSLEIEIKEAPEGFRSGHLYEAFHVIGDQGDLPRTQPAYGLFQNLNAKPVVILDAESAAFLTALFLPDEALQVGFAADRHNPTRVISLSGCVSREWTAEVPCGVSLRSVIEEIGSGIAGNGTFKAVQTDAPWGRLLGPDALDQCAHCLLSGKSGSSEGRIDVMDRDTDVLALVASRMAAVQEHSCGKCLFCFEGSRQIIQALGRITAGRGVAGDIALVKEIGEGMKDGCGCALGRAASEFVLTGTELFRTEYQQRIGSSPGKVQAS